MLRSPVLVYVYFEGKRDQLARQKLQAEEISRIHSILEFLCTANASGCPSKNSDVFFLWRTRECVRFKLYTIVASWPFGKPKFVVPKDCLQLQLTTWVRTFDEKTPKVSFANQKKEYISTDPIISSMLSPTRYFLSYKVTFVCSTLAFVKEKRGGFAHAQAKKIPYIST